MGRKSKEYHKIIEFLKHSDTKIFNLGIQLLQSTLNSKLIAQILNDKSYISYKIAYHLVPLFQTNEKVWGNTQNIIPVHIKNEILHWMPHELLDLEEITVRSFCELANNKAQVHFPNFPELSPDILTEEERIDVRYYGRWGAKYVGKEGWSLRIEEEYQGPAETVCIKKWEAKAHHPEYSIKIKRENTKIWLETPSPKET
ncbi:hypothetical protein OAK19_00585 [Aureispira]|nr:hypothetical protein [Aureispira sp.]